MFSRRKRLVRIPLPFPPTHVLLVCLLTLAAFAQSQDITAMRKNAAAGSAQAQYDLARAYYSGNGIAMDPKQGLDWLRKSAAQSYPAAEYALGVIFQRGDQSVSQNPHEAANWFRRAARHHNQDANDRLNKMLAQGLISKQEADWHFGEPGEHAVKQAKKGPPAFSLIEVESGLTGGITSKRMATLVSTYGVDFPLTASARRRLAGDGADDNLLAAISSSRR